MNGVLRKAIVVAGFLALALPLVAASLKWKRADEARAAAEARVLELEHGGMCPLLATPRIRGNSQDPRVRHAALRYS